MDEWADTADIYTYCVYVVSLIQMEAALHADTLMAL